MGADSPGRLWRAGVTRALARRRRHPQRGDQRPSRRIPRPRGHHLRWLPCGHWGRLRRMYACDKTIDATLEHLRASPRRWTSGSSRASTTTANRSSARSNIASCGASGLVDRYVNASSKRLGGKAVLHREPPSHLGLHARDREVAPRWTRHRDVRDQQRPRVQRSAGWRRHTFFAPDASLSDGVSIVVIEDVTLSRILLPATRIYQGEQAYRRPSSTPFRGRTHVEPSRRPRGSILTERRPASPSYHPRAPAATSAPRGFGDGSRREDPQAR